MAQVMLLKICIAGKLDQPWKVGVNFECAAIKTCSAQHCKLKPETTKVKRTEECKALKTNKEILKAIQASTGS